MSTAAVKHKASWATGAYFTRALGVPDQATQFDQLVYAQGLERRPDLWRHNDKLRRFARVNRRTRYIPEWYLAELGLCTEVEL